MRAFTVSMIMCMFENTMSVFLSSEISSLSYKQVLPDIFTIPRKMATQIPYELTDGRDSGEELYIIFAITLSNLFILK